MAESYTYYAKGTTNTICDISGFKCKLSECVTTWDGLLVRADFYEPRNPQDLPVTPRPSKVFSNVRTESDQVNLYTPPTKEDLSQ